MLKRQPIKTNSAGPKDNAFKASPQQTERRSLQGEFHLPNPFAATGDPETQTCGDEFEQRITHRSSNAQQREATSSG